MLWIVTSSVSLNAVRFGAHATVSQGRGLSAQHQRALLTMAVSDDRAARAWLGNQDAVPAVQPPVAPMSVEEARAILNVACDKGLVEACDALTSFITMGRGVWSRSGWGARGFRSAAHPATSGVARRGDARAELLGSPQDLGYQRVYYPKAQLRSL